MTRRILFAAALAMLAVTGVAGSASARWWGDGRWHDDDRWRHHDRDDYYYGYHYRPPPVVYATPYNYGYVPPPVVYGAEPGVNFSINIP
ncbi:MAG TPA: hypothetical protein VKY24_08675 [Reyranella sp.]|nr:hypothetical protein [Reyranella sp.]